MYIYFFPIDYLISFLGALNPSKHLPINLIIIKQKNVTVQTT